MPLIYLAVVLVVVGFLLWLINTHVPMDSRVKSVINAVVVIAVVLWLLSVFGVLNYLTEVKVPSF